MNTVQGSVNTEFNEWPIKLVYHIANPYIVTSKGQLRRAHGTNHWYVLRTLGSTITNRAHIIVQSLQLSASCLKLGLSSQEYKAAQGATRLLSVFDWEA